MHTARYQNIPFNCGNRLNINFRFCCVETVVKTSKPYASAMRIANKIAIKSQFNKSQRFFLMSSNFKQIK